MIRPHLSFNSPTSYSCSYIHPVPLSKAPPSSPAPAEDYVLSGSNIANRSSPISYNSQIPAYKDAVDLAILEESWTDSNNPPKEFPIRLCLRRLVQNSDLASSATAAWDTNEASNSISDSYQTRTYTSIQASYYFTRKLLLACRRPESRADLLLMLYEILRASSIETINTHCDFPCFLTSSYAAYEEQLRHGIPKAKGNMD